MIVLVHRTHGNNKYKMFHVAIIFVLLACSDGVRCLKPLRRKTKEFQIFISYAKQHENYSL